MTDKNRNRTLYEVLGVSRSAKVTEIQLAYNRLRAEMKKESSAPDPRLAAMAKVAVETLTDPRKRAQYDKTLDALIPRQASGVERAERRRVATQRLDLRRDAGGREVVEPAVVVVDPVAGGDRRVAPRETVEVAVNESCELRRPSGASRAQGQRTRREKTQAKEKTHRQTGEGSGGPPKLRIARARRN